MQEVVKTYPDIKLVNRERKVKHRELKEKIRGGTKFQNRAILGQEIVGIGQFINKII